ncbi:hypothetical protein [Dyadobacter sp. 50-39]|nr:hypothetical protein [Dyadobacter sp. 50-39]
MATDNLKAEAMEKWVALDKRSGTYRLLLEGAELLDQVTALDKT